MDDLQGGTLALEHRYDLSKRAGEFALYSVYRGVQHPFQRPIWVKVCAAPAEFRAPDFYERLKQSVVKSAEFRHDGILEIVDFGDFDTHIPFVVTERREGALLVDTLSEEGTLSPSRALSIASSLASTLRDAHKAGLVHGGVAPKWITLHDDQVHLDHFGLQPTMSEIRAMEGAILSSDLLWALPPEQFDDEEQTFDSSSDVWGLGVLLYWMLAGVHPYFDDPTDTGDAVLRLRNKANPESLTTLGVETEVANLVGAALEPDPDERISMSQLNARLDKLVSPRSPAQAPPERPSVPVEPVVTVADEAPRPLGTVLAVVAALLLLSNIGWFFLYTSARGVTEEVTPPPTDTAVLPIGVTLETVPPGATVHLREGDKEFGDTPLILDPKSGGGRLSLVVRKHGHEPAEIDVTTESGGHQLLLHLEPTADAAPAASDAGR